MSGKLIQEGLDWHARNFLEGNLDALLPRYAEVMPVYLEGRMVLIEGHDALREELEKHRDQVLASGVTNLRAFYTGGEHVDVGRYMFTALWRYSYDGKQRPRTASAAYFCRRNDSPSIIEMIEYRKLAFRKSPTWHAILPVSPITHGTSSRFLH